MLSKRIIPCLDVKDGRVVKGINFVNLRDARDPVEAAEAYCREGADELVFLDIFATVENRKTRFEWVKKVCEVVTVPFAAMPNILRGRQIVPELLQEEASVKNLADQTLRILKNEADCFLISVVRAKSKTSSIILFISKIEFCILNHFSLSLESNFEIISGVSISA